MIFFFFLLSASVGDTGTTEADNVPSAQPVVRTKKTSPAKRAKAIQTNIAAQTDTLRASGDAVKGMNQVISAINRHHEDARRAEKGDCPDGYSTPAVNDYISLTDTNTPPCFTVLVQTEPDIVTEDAGPPENMDGETEGTP